MGPHVLVVRFGVLPSKDVIASRVRDEVGEETTGELEIDWRYEPKKLREAAYRGDLPTSAVSFTSIDLIALIYVRKICVALGGIPIDPVSGDPQSTETPAWARLPWVLLNPLERLRIRLRVLHL